MSKSWQEVQTLLEDPYVSADTKEALLIAYVRENGGREFPFRIPSEAEPYLDEYNLKGDNLPFGMYMTTDQAAAAAQRESDDMGYAGRQRDQQVQEDAAELDGMQPPSAGGAGVETSDELFDLAKSALTMFEKFLPVNAKAPSEAMGRHGALDFGRDVQTLFDEQRGINFKKFLEEAERLREAHGVLSGLQSTTETQLNSLYQKWTGPAANASYDYYTREITPNATELLGFLETAPSTIETAVQTVYEACKSKCDQVINLYSPTLGSATPEIADKVMVLARGEFDSQEQVLEVAAWVDSVCGSNLESTIRADDCGLNDGNKQYVISECKKWIRESFNVDLHDGGGRYTLFKQLCEDTRDAVDDAWETLNTYLKDYENEFTAAPTVTTPGSQPPGTSTPPPSSSTPPPSSSTPPQSSTPPPSSSPPPSVSTPPSSSTPGPGTTPSGTTPGSSTPTVPPVPAVTGPGLPGSGSTDPSFAGGGSHIPGGSAGGVPGAKPGGPGSGMPTVPTPGSTLPSGVGGSPGTPGTPGSSGAPKEVTIKDGNRTITVGEPDARGRSKITVDDGTGKPKTYEMDFGAAMGAFGSDPSLMPDVGGLGGDLGGEVVKAGEDGKAVIHDGDTTITAERVPGSPDQMKLTVDDGTPPPSTYTVDFDEGSGAVPGPGLDVPETPSSMASAGGVDVPGSDGSASGFGGSSGGGGGGGVPGAGAGSQPGPMDGGAMSGAQSPAPGEQRPAAAAASPGPTGGPGQGGPMGGGMPMGGMGAGAGQGGDQTRGGSKWRTQGQLFDDVDPAAHFSGVVGEDPANRANRPTKR